VHWDFMLEMDDTLATWALPRPPDATNPMIVEALPDHRLAYLDYEGPISGGRGSVTRWDWGTYLIQLRDDAELVVKLKGQTLAGRVTLARQSREPGRWRFTFTSD
jgi:hypothetical protein